MLVPDPRYGSPFAGVVVERKSSVGCRSGPSCSFQSDQASLHTHIQRRRKAKRDHLFSLQKNGNSSDCASFADGREASPSTKKTQQAAEQTHTRQRFPFWSITSGGFLASTPPLVPSARRCQRCHALHANRLRREELGQFEGLELWAHVQRRALQVIKHNRRL